MSEGEARPLRLRHWDFGPEADQVTIRLTRAPTPEEREQVRIAVGQLPDLLEPRA